MRLSLAAALLLLSLALFGAPSPSSAQKKNEFVHKASGIAFPVPDGFAPVPATMQHSIAAYGKSDPGSRSRFSVQVLPIPKDQPADSIPPGAEDEILKSMAAMPRFEKAGTARFKVKGVEAMSLGFFLSSGGPPGRELVIRGRSVLLVRRGSLYIFTFMASEETFPAETKAFEKVVNGVRWL